MSMHVAQRGDSKGQLVNCPANIQCTLKDENGGVAQHFENQKDYENHLSETHNPFKSMHRPHINRKIKKIAVSGAMIGTLMASTTACLNPEYPGEPSQSETTISQTVNESVKQRTSSCMMPMGNPITEAHCKTMGIPSYKSFMPD